MAAAVVDHIVPHKGNRGLFWDRDNWQALCEPCHRGVKARLERRWMIGEIDAARLRLDRDVASETTGDDGDVVAAHGVNWHPAFLRPSMVPLTIVCGPPLAGKSRYVDAAKGDRAFVIDIDVIASAIAGTGLHEWPLSVLTEAGRQRNAMLAGLADRGALRWASAWLIVSEPDAAWREWWSRHLGAQRIVVIETPADVCRARAVAERSDPSRAIAGIDDWWRRYSRRDGDNVMMG